MPSNYLHEIGHSTRIQHTIKSRFKVGTVWKGENVMPKVRESVLFAVLSYGFI